MAYDNSQEVITVDHKPSGPGFFGRLLRTFFRILLTVLVGAVLGGAVYFGARSFYRQAVTIPAETSLLRMDDLSEAQARHATRSAGEMEDLRQRINNLEKDRKIDAEDISSLQAEVLTLNDQMEQAQAAADRLEKMQENLSAVATQSMKNGMDLDNFLSSGNSPVAELRQEIQLLRAMELLNRTRLYLSQSNYGLAEQDANLVRQIFLQMKQEAGVENQAAIDVWIARMDMALANLNTAPAVAGEDLEMVWRMVLVGLPLAESTPGGQDGTTPSGTPPASPTSTPPTPRNTPTPAPTLTPATTTPAG